MARRTDSGSGSGSASGGRELTSLYSPDGRLFQTASLAEITRLKAAGYSEDEPPKEEAEAVAKAEAEAVAGPPPPPTL